MKMYGGGEDSILDMVISNKTVLCCAGMGDQIKRYCEKLEPEEYEELLDNEVTHSEWTHSQTLDIYFNSFYCRQR